LAAEFAPNERRSQVLTGDWSFHGKKMNFKFQLTHNGLRPFKRFMAGFAAKPMGNFGKAVSQLFSPILTAEELHSKRR
jgi:hypothetical protein